MVVTVYMSIILNTEFVGTFITNLYTNFQTRSSYRHPTQSQIQISRGLHIVLKTLP